MQEGKPFYFQNIYGRDYANELSTLSSEVTKVS
jgi:hypothetical protein